MINVLFVDDHEMVRIGVSAYLSAQPDIEVVGEASDGAEGVKKALDLRPDIILMDLVMEEMDGIQATKEIISRWPEAKIIIVTSFRMSVWQSESVLYDLAIFCNRCMRNCDFP